MIGYLPKIEIMSVAEDGYSNRMAAKFQKSNYEYTIGVSPNGVINLTKEKLSVLPSGTACTATHDIEKFNLPAIDIPSLILYLQEVQRFLEEEYLVRKLMGVKK